MTRGEVRRTDRQMTEDEAMALLNRAFCCRIGTCDEEGWPYVVPNLFVLMGGAVYFHTAKSGHLRTNIEQNSRVCIEVDEPGFVFPYGESAPCETSVGYESAVVYGSSKVVDDEHMKVMFFEQFMDKYADASWVRPNVWPLLNATTVYVMTIDRITAKRRPVEISDRWKSQFAHLLEPPLLGE